MKSTLPIGVRLASGLGVLLLLFVCADVRVLPQEELLVPSLPAPPPMKFVPRLERAQLSGIQDAKSRVKASITMAETRLLRAEQFTIDQRFISASSELGVYQAIIEDVLRFLGLQKTDSNKTRDLYKRLEIQLRLHALRIEAMRRVTPKAYAVHIKSAWDFSDNARAKALNAFFSDTVVRQRSTESDKPLGVKNSPSTPASPASTP
jgi:hypothetical protein